MQLCWAAADELSCEPGAWPALLPSLHKPHCSPSSSLRQASTGRNGCLAWKVKGDCFAYCCVLYSSKCALNTGSSSDTSASLLPEICKEERGQKATFPWLLSHSCRAVLSRTAFLTLWTSPLSVLCLDLLLGTFGISEKCTDQESQVPFAALPPALA